ncbi:hypothetical protein [Kordiimonas laminariae]|uniref:hypothetical protein n=1 Tax=Kordiimonas laminariae TaxID=2917717 RepID=UPI001FF4DC78|nr:hypothetical protein [Kordiimonas laminariae]MCK0070722.1 hypothetical protein [Kordiimonas laminariae]
MSGYDEWHGKNKGAAKDEFNLQSERSQDKLLKRMRQRAKEAEQKIASKQKPSTPPQPTYTPKNAELKRGAEAQAKADIKAAKARNKNVSKSSANKPPTKDQQRMKKLLSKSNDKSPDRER